MDILFSSQRPAYNRMRQILEVHQSSEAKVRPHFFLTGPTGSGKSYLVGKLCEELDIKMFEINAAQLTAEGLSGNSLTKALRPLRECWNTPNVCFVDEFDKLFQRNGETTEGFRSQVQDEFLHMLNSKYASVFTDYGKYEPVVSENTLFIFAGAFSDQKILTIEELAETGIRREFIGRVPLVAYMQKVSLTELKKFLPQVELFKNYLKLFPQTDPKAAAKAITDSLSEKGLIGQLGIRMLQSAIHTYFIGKQ